MSIVEDIAARVFRQPSMPERTGPYAVGTARLRLNAKASGQGRAQRPIVVQLWYPADEKQSDHARKPGWFARLMHPTWASAYHRAPLALSKSRFPLIVYVPDKHGNHDDNTFTLANLASHGFILAAIDKPYRSGSNRGTALDAGQIAGATATASAVLDALDALPSTSAVGMWTERLNLRQVGILGYAAGGLVAAAAAVADRRFGVVGSLDGIANGPGRLKVPYLLMLRDFSLPPSHSGAPEDTDAASREEDYRHAELQAALPDSHVIEVAGASREHFSDKLRFPSRVLAGHRNPDGFKRTRAIVDSYTAAFFTTYLRTDPHPLMCVRHSPYPEVHFVAGGTEGLADWALHEPAGRG